MKRPKIGDVIEIDDDKSSSVFYAQFTHENPMYGELIRVFDVKAEKGCSAVVEHIVYKPVIFTVFYPLAASLRRRIFKTIGWHLPRKDLTPFPVFRAGHWDPATRSVNEWWLWDGNQEWYVGHLKEPERYPIRQIVNDTLLCEIIRGRLGSS